MHFTPRRIVLTVTVVFAVALVAVLALLRDPAHRRDSDPIAVYDSYSFIGQRSRDGQWFTELHPRSATDVSKRGRVYIRLPGGDVFLIWDIQEDAIQKILVADPVGRELGGTCYGDLGTSYFLFINGQLERARVTHDLKGFRIGPTPDGPFIELPVKRERLLEVFGEPVRWDHFEVPRPMARLSPVPADHFPSPASIRKFTGFLCLTIQRI